MCIIKETKSKAITVSNKWNILFLLGWMQLCQLLGSLISSRAKFINRLVPNQPPYAFIAAATGSVHHLCNALQLLIRPLWQLPNPSTENKGSRHKGTPLTAGFPPDCTPCCIWNTDPSLSHSLNSGSPYPKMLWTSLDTRDCSNASSTTFSAVTRD